MIDIDEFLLEKDIKIEGVDGVRYMCHDPCDTPMRRQDPMKRQDPMETVRCPIGAQSIKTDRGCGESGTLAVTRPDISAQIRFRKQEELGKS